MNKKSLIFKTGIVMALLLIYVFFSFFSYANTVTKDLRKSVFRLHIIANSDSKEDQNLKYIVRNEVLMFMSKLYKEAESKEKVIEITLENIENIKKVAEEVVVNEGYNYDVTVEVGSYNFPTKTYGDISLPAGNYDALEIKIGKAEGKNWWCVMFPSLCFVDINNGYLPQSSKKILEENLLSEEYNLISSEDTEYKIKFKLLELFEKTKILTAKK